MTEFSFDKSLLKETKRKENKPFWTIVLTSPSWKMATLQFSFWNVTFELKQKHMSLYHVDQSLAFIYSVQLKLTLMQIWQSNIYFLGNQSRRCLKSHGLIWFIMFLFYLFNFWCPLREHIEASSSVFFVFVTGMWMDQQAKVRQYR